MRGVKVGDLVVFRPRHDSRLGVFEYSADIGAIAKVERVTVQWLDVHWVFGGNKQMDGAYFKTDFVPLMEDSNATRSRRRSHTPKSRRPH